MKKAFITGISGFAGNFLARALLDSEKFEVSGTYHSESSLSQLHDISSSLALEKVDLTDAKHTEDIIGSIVPDIVFHLAALASPAQSFKDPSLTFSTNITGQINLLEALKKHKCEHTRIIIVSSAEVYGVVTNDMLPIDEDTPMRPVSPYAVSKITQDYLGLQYYLTYKQQVIRARPFNHIGPGQKTAYAVSAFAEQIAQIEKKKKEPVLHVGNLSARRDFTDVRDIVQAYILLAEKGAPGDVYNIGSGTSYEMSEILQKLVSFSTEKITIETDQSRFMPVDIPDNRCDPKKLQEKTGWKPAISIDTSLRDVLDYWRNIA